MSNFLYLCISLLILFILQYIKVLPRKFFWNNVRSSNKMIYSCKNKISIYYLLCKFLNIWNSNCIILFYFNLHLLFYYFYSNFFKNNRRLKCKSQCITPFTEIANTPVYFWILLVIVFYYTTLTFITITTNSFCNDFILVSSIQIISSILYF